MNELKKVPVGFRFKAGDVVLVPAMIKYDPDSDDDDERIIVTAGLYTDFSIAIKEIFAIVSRKFEIGDPVRVRGDSDPATVIGVDEEEVWVKFDNGQRGAYPSISVDRIESEPAKVEAPFNSMVVGDDDIKF